MLNNLLMQFASRTHCGSPGNSHAMISERFWVLTHARAATLCLDPLIWVIAKIYPVHWPYYGVNDLILFRYRFGYSGLWKILCNLITDWVFDVVQEIPKCLMDVKVSQEILISLLQCMPGSSLTYSVLGL